jgi:SAM-dependent methyltransferase
MPEPARVAVADASTIAPGDRVLDIGCGSGEFARLASSRGARVSGIDAAEGMLAIARRNAPDADLRLRSMEALPWEDGSFDVVTAFNSFQFASDYAVPLREAVRVVRPGEGRVAICNWGRSGEQDVEVVEDALAELLPSGRPDRGDRPAVGEPGVVEELARAAGLEPFAGGEVDVALDVPDDAAAIRAFMLDAGLLHVLDHASEATVHATILEAAAPFRRPDGSYRFDNRFRYVVSRA